MHETNQNKPRITCHGRIDLGDDCVRVSMGEKQRDSLVASVFPPYLYLGAQGAQGLVSTVVGTNVTRENGKASSKWEENTSITNIDIDIEERSQGKKIQLETLINHSKERVESEAW